MWKIPTLSLQTQQAFVVDELREYVSDASEMICDGATVAFPTETVYGLGADARNSDAVAQIFAAKGRPADNPLIVHIASQEQLGSFVMGVNEWEQQLIDQFWPGPLTLILPVKADALSPLVTAGLTTVGVRIPEHPVALALLAECNVPVAAPSANRSGKPSPTQAKHVWEDLHGRINGIVDGGAANVGVESTVVEVVDDMLYILRPGGITSEQLQAALPQAKIRFSKQSDKDAPKSPGVKYAHYAPNGQLQLVTGATSEEVVAFINKSVVQARKHGEKTAVLAYSEMLPFYKADRCFDIGARNNPEQGAQQLYDVLRQCDAQGIDRIWAEYPPEGGLHEALRNRLFKAAAAHLIDLS
ncbi:L-threonylcarbamoyladenylate synthase [Paenibacillus yanchengensis]|uniref:L-threonylcarbamoyladenylate synthase n=1 Tax=Paenibacillus yanchengensis TaxID=2035833 RepID=UPI0036733399